jgi:enolase
MLGVSLAVAKAAANCVGLPLYQYIGGCNAKVLPVPMLNCINGGKHADNKLSIQEFMIAPIAARTFSEAIEMSSNVFHTLAKLLKADKHITSVGDEGGFAPNFESDEMAIEYLVRAIEAAGYIPGADFKLALDVAASEMYKEATLHGKEGQYMFFKTGKFYTTDQLVDYYESLVNKFPIYSIEDALDEDDLEGFSRITDKLGKRIQLVGDDLYVTNTQRIKRGIECNAGNAVLIKPNQIGTLTETLDAIALTKNHGWNAIVSHRSGETPDTSIADIAVATGAGQIKTGAPSRGERIAKYNRLLRIEHELDKSAIYGKNLYV